MPVNSESVKKTVIRELATFLCLVLFGLLILPLAIYMVGKSVFGEFGGTGFSGFNLTLHAAIRDGEPAVLFLVLAPYLIWQLSRLTVWGFRQAGRRRQQIRG